MPDEIQGLSDEERAELDALRAEKARREEAERVRRERSELEKLKAERARSEREREKDERARQIRERNARLMEPDDDLKMPVGQKLVLLAILFVVVAIVLAMTLGR